MKTASFCVVVVVVPLLSACGGSSTGADAKLIASVGDEYAAANPRGEYRYNSPTSRTGPCSRPRG